MPVARRAAPAHGQDAVDDLFGARRRAIPQRGEIRDQADEPEEQRNCEVGRNCEDIPDQRAAELRPDAHGTRVRDHPISEPRAPRVHERKNPRAHHGEESHRFGKAIDRGAPLLIQQEQDRGDQRAGVADTNPPDEIDDGEAPADRNLNAPDPRAFQDEVGQRDKQRHRQREGNGEAEIPTGPCGPREND